MTASRRRKRFDDLPEIPIGAVLTELGAPDVPTGFGWVRCKCFAHEDRTPSAAVNHELNAFVCHSCGLKGDSLKLLMDERRLSFREALELGRTLSGESGAKPKVRTRRASDLLRRD